MVGSLVVVGALARYALLHCECDLKATHMNLLYDSGTYAPRVQTGS